jgi:hypothetical protein
VSALIWIVMALGALVLFGMIGYRLPGQIRARRAELAAGDHEAGPDPDPDPDPGPAPDPEPDPARGVEPGVGPAPADGAAPSTPQMDRS